MGNAYIVMTRSTRSRSPEDGPVILDTAAAALTAVYSLGGDHGTSCVYRAELYSGPSELSTGVWAMRIDRNLVKGPGSFGQQELTGIP